MTDFTRSAYDHLRRALVAYVQNHTNPSLARFKAAIGKWSDDAGVAPDSVDSLIDCREGRYSAVHPALLPAADLLQTATTLAKSGERDLIDTFYRYRQHLKFEQSYSRADRVVGDDMLSGYAFAEIIGKHGPFVSEEIRCGIGLWGSNIDYPLHRHLAEEVYVLLAGSAKFALATQWQNELTEEIRAPIGVQNNDADSGAVDYVRRLAGDVVLVKSNQTHGFRTEQQLLAVLYIWQHGDLRETSSFRN